MQINNNTLVIGVDIAKKKHYARAFDAWLQDIQQKHGMIEVIQCTTGDHLEACGYRFAIVNSYHVKCARELDDNNPSKSDHKDLKTIAMFVKGGRYRDVYIPVGVYQELREFVCEQEKLQERFNSLKTKFPVGWTSIFRGLQPYLRTGANKQLG